MDPRLLETVALPWGDGAELALLSTGATSRELTLTHGQTRYSSRWDPREDGPNWVLDPLPSLPSDARARWIDAIWAGASRLGAAALLAYASGLDAYAVERWSHPDGFAIVRVDGKRVEIASPSGTLHVPSRAVPAAKEPTARLRLGAAAWVLPEARPCDREVTTGLVERLNDPARRAFFLTDYPWRFVAEE